MYHEEKKKRQNLKVIISEAIMVLAVVVTVVVLGFIVSGYWINSDFEVERQGMLQINSSPSGAYIDIDGETSSWLQRTNTSKVISSGEHTVTLKKDGYDTWSKTINVKEGLLYRLHYPRLFLENRTAEKMLNVTGSTSATISPDKKTLIVLNNTTKWSYINLDNDKPTAEVVDVSKLFSGVSLAENASAGLLNEEIISLDWDYDGSHLLVHAKTDDVIEWVLLDIKNVSKSINLTKEFSNDFDQVKILDNSSSNLLAIYEGGLRKIDVASRQISAVMAEDVVNFDHFENEVVFLARSDEEDKKNGEYYIGYFKVGDEEITKLESTDNLSKVVISKFYDEKYITVLTNDKVSLYKQNDYSLVNEYELSFAPERMKVGHNGEFITMYSNSQIATLDMEASLVREWNIDGKEFGWIDNDAIYSIAEGELIVYDYDGYNRRVLAKNVSSHYPASVTANKWLYYFSDEKLMREWIVEH